MAVFAEGMEATSALSRLEAWQRQHSKAIEKCRSLIADVKAQGKTDLAVLSVVLRAIAQLSDSARVRSAPISAPGS